MKTDSASNHAPLIPMSEMFMSNTTECQDARQPADKQQSSKRTSSSYSFDIIDNELESLAKIQDSNNEEIKKRLAEIQRLRENNLLVVGAVGGLKKIKEKL